MDPPEVRRLRHHGFQISFRSASSVYFLAMLSLVGSALNSGLTGSIYSSMERTAVEFGNERQRHQTRKTRLWLLTCETRTGSVRKSVNYRLWLKSALYVQKNGSHEESMIYRGVGIGNPNVFLEEVKVKNVCSDLSTYTNHRTKTLQMKKFLSNLLSTKNSTIMDLVLFSDSDALFNFNAVTAAEVVERFSTIVENAKKESTHREVSGENSVVVTAESQCWIGHRHCERILPRYPLVTEGKSNCPQFVNSGGYMGSPSALLPMMQYMLDINEADNVGEMWSDQSLMTTFYLNHHHYTPPPAQIAYRYARKHSHVNDTNVVSILDRHASIFRSLMVGFFVEDQNATNPVFERSPVSSLISMKFPQVENVTAGMCLGPHYAQMASLSGIKDTDYLESHPFHIHANGRSKPFLKEIMKEFETIPDIDQGK